MRADTKFLSNVDWILVCLYGVLVLMGWINIYAAVYDEQVQRSIFDMGINSGKQLMWICSALILIIVIMAVDFKFYSSFSYIIYGLLICTLIFVLLFGREVAGSKSWFELGPIRMQPAEFMKFAIALALAKFFEDPSRKFDSLKDWLGVAFFCGLPMALIVLQGDTGSALVFASLGIVLFREGFPAILFAIVLTAATIFILALLYPPLYLVIGVAVIAAIIIFFGEKKLKRILGVIIGAVLISGVVFSVDYVVDNVFKPHQQNRVKAFISPESDPLGYGYNVTQSKIAIGSGGLFGKGFLKGTQTKFDFVPEQSTDFIFCTLGEEQGWLGCMLVIGLFVILFFRIIALAERQKSRFARVYAYSVVSIMFFHFVVNIGMTIGLFPVIGIPLPFFSYGGSSLWSFTILLFILIKLDAHRMQLLQH